MTGVAGRWRRRGEGTGPVRDGGEGAGLDEGIPCFAATAKLHGKLCKQKCFAQAPALQRVVAGGCLDGIRYAGSDPVQ